MPRAADSALTLGALSVRSPSTRSVLLLLKPLPWSELHVAGSALHQIVEALRAPGAEEL